MEILKEEEGEMVEIIKKIAKTISEVGGRAFFVGGCVRDSLLGLPSKDFDVEVYGITADKLIEVLSHFGEVDLVGRSFGVLKLKGLEVDFTLPRRENKIGKGHKGFVVSVDPDMPFEEACRRRDFTINAILKDVLTGEIIDPCSGFADLEKKIIRHIDDETFVEDSLRVYRGVQLAARLGFEIHPATLNLMSKIDLSDLPKERIYEEFKKLLLKAEKPSIGLRYLQILGVLEKMHPLLHNMVGCEQDPQHHPEGDVWEHTLRVVDAAAQLKNQSEDPEALMFAALLHDIGKPAVTEKIGERIVSHGHDKAGEEIARSFMKTLTNEKKLISNVATLVREHMTPFALYKEREKVTEGAIRRFARRVNVHEVLLLAEADNAGKGNSEDFTPVKKWFAEATERLKLDQIEPLIRGRDLIAMGFEPSPKFGKVLKFAFELQLDGLPYETIRKKVFEYMLKE